MTNRKLGTLARTLLLFLLCSCFDLGVFVNDEGKALLKFKEEVKLDPYGALRDWKEEDASEPCFWFGVGCDGGHVVALNLSNLGLEGKLAPEIGKLVHLKFLILHNNSLSGAIPQELASLHNLELLDLGHNNFSGPIPPDLSNISSSKILILEANRLTVGIQPQLPEHTQLSSKGSTRRDGDATIRRLVGTNPPPQNTTHQANGNSKPIHDSGKNNPSTPPPPPPPPPHPPPPLLNGVPGIGNPTVPTHELSPRAPPPPPATAANGTKRKHSVFLSVLFIPAVGAVSFVAVLAVLYAFCWRSSKIVTIGPWATGLSGQLQKAFVTGAPSLKRSELEAACEDFSNIIGSIPGCKLYKGTLSTGVEIAVLSAVVKSSKEWSKQSESQFRKKITTLSKVSHKNFVNLLGYCEEEEPFTRMMVFEYAPNGTLSEHLRVKEGDQMEWGSRLRIAMGIAYCLEHLHQLDPPVILQNLDSTTVYLTDDYAAKISDLGMWNESKENESSSGDPGPSAEKPDLESVVRRFGILLLEILSGKLPEEGDGAVERWASPHLNGLKPLKEVIDPTLLGSFNEEMAAALCRVISSCIHPEPKERPTMQQVSGQLRGITLMPPDRASPKVSPLWWAHLEMISPEAS